MTAPEISAAIDANVTRYFADAVDHATFHAENRRLHALAGPRGSETREELAAIMLRDLRQR